VSDEQLFAVVIGEGDDPTTKFHQVRTYKNAIETAKREARTNDRRYGVFKLVHTHTFKFDTCPGCEGCGKVEAE
jgi:hypothetical protein